MRAVNFDWETEQLVRQHVRLESRCGWNGPYPILTFSCESRGAALALGFELYSLHTDGQEVPLVRVAAPTPDDEFALYQFWAVPVEHHRRLYAFLRRLHRRSLQVPAPVMREADREQLWNNTVGFLQHGREILRKYGVPQKRGVLLLGSPGNGKTMACRWLCTLCSQYGLDWREVDTLEFDSARSEGTAHKLFELDRPGIILFDDVDQKFRDREEFGGSDCALFLTQLDGLRPRNGVVYLFTSNAQLTQLDPAFRRPGRIDLALRFDCPDETLRRRFVLEHWHAEIVAAINVEEVVSSTAGLSFAEIEELKRLLVMRQLERGKWDWQDAWQLFHNGRATEQATQRIGFQAIREAAPLTAITTAAELPSL